jgi:hypothetical protein
MTCDYRFVLAEDSRQKIGCIHLGDLVNSEELNDDTLRAHGIEFVKTNPEYVIMCSTTHMIVVDCGNCKLTGGLGASHPFETIILTRPS